MSNNLKLEDLPPPEKLESLDSLPSPEQLAPPEEPKVSKIESLIRGGLQGATFGLADELTGALAGSPVGAFKTMANLIGGSFYDQDTDEYKRVRDEARRAYKQAEEANRLTSIAGNIMGGLIPSAATLVATGGTAAPVLAGAAGEAATAAGTAGKALSAGEQLALFPQAISATAEAAPALAGVAGEAVSAAPTIAKGAETVGKLQKGLQSLSNVQKGALVGGLEGAGYGLGQSEEESLKGLAKDVGLGGTLGAGIGAASGKLGRFLFGNEEEIARGVLKGATPDKGLIPSFTGSKMANVIKEFTRASEKGIDTSTVAGQEARDAYTKKIAQELLEEIKTIQSSTGKKIGQKVEEAGALQLKNIQSALSELPQEMQEDVIKIIPAKYKQVLNAPVDTIEALNSAQTKLTKLINEEPGVVANIFKKRSASVAGAEQPYELAGEEVAGEIRKKLAADPDQFIEDLTKAATTGEISPDLQSISENLKIKSNLGKMAKAAREENIISPKTSEAQDLIDTVRSLKAEVAQAGKTSVVEVPEQVIKKTLKSYDTSHLTPIEINDSYKLQDLFKKYVSDGSVKGDENTRLFRNELYDFIQKAESKKFKDIASDLHKQTVDFRNKAAGEELNRQYSNIKQQLDFFKADMAGAGEVEKAQDIATKFAKKVSKEGGSTISPGDVGVKAGLEDLSKLSPKSAELIQELKQQGLYNQLYGIQTGKEGSVLNDAVNRLLYALPGRLVGRASTSEGVQKVASIGRAALDLPPASWQLISKKLETVSPKISKLASEMATSTDEAKKRAILNILNQLPKFRQAIGSLAGIDNK